MKKRSHLFSVIIILLTLGMTLTLSSSTPLRSYKEILKTGIKPKIQPDYQFPLSQQTGYSCFGFAVKHLADYKYNIKIDVADGEKRIAKPATDLWKSKQMMDFLDLYGLRLRWYSDGETLFKMLEEGEPVIMQYRFHQPNGSWIGHFVAAYSFDENGVWVAESVANKRAVAPYEDIFDESGRYVELWFATMSKR